MDWESYLTNRPGGITICSADLSSSAFQKAAHLQAAYQNQMVGLQSLMGYAVGGGPQAPMPHQSTPQVTQPKKEIGMFGEMVADVRGFVHEHRFVIYTVAVIFLVDHFMFNGKFRDRLREIVEKMICRCERKVTEAIEK